VRDTGAMTAHAIEYVRVRTPTGTLPRNLSEVEAALDRRGDDGYQLVSTVPDTLNGDLVGVLLLFTRPTDHLPGGSS
jgi:hypothetical protein